MIFESILIFSIVFATAGLTTLLLVPVISKWALHFGLVDKPDTRRLHKVPVPRVGGIAVFIGFHIACACYFLMPWHLQSGIFNIHSWAAFVVASSWIFFVGLYDDIRGLKPQFKLIAQLIAGLAMFLAGVSAQNIFGFQLPWLIDLSLSLFWYIIIINAFNLIDGLDGLASGLGIIAALGMVGSLLFRHLPGDALIMTALLGACAAFLRFNFNPASIFLGDCGSMTIGFIVATVALATSSKGTILAAIGVPLLAVGVPLFDTLLAIWRRSVRATLSNSNGQTSKGLMQFDMDHLHHRLLRSGRTQRNAAYTLYLVNIALVLVGLTSLAFSAQAWGIFVIAFVVGAYIIARHVAYVELWDSGVALLQGFSAPSNPVLAVLLYPLIDFLLLASASLTALLVCAYSFGTLSYESVLNNWFFSVPILCGVPFIVLFLTGTYSRVWSRARIAEFFFLAASIVAGIILASGALAIVQSQYSSLRLAEWVLYSALAIAFTAGFRSAPSAILDLMSHIGKQLNSASACNISTLIYGAGNRGILFLNIATSEAVHARKPATIVGFIDDDRNLRGRNVRGFKVLGTLRELSSLLQSGKISEVTLTAPLSDKRLARLRRICRQYSVALFEFRPQSRCLFAANAADVQAVNDKIRREDLPAVKEGKIAIH